MRPVPCTYGPPKVHILSLWSYCSWTLSDKPNLVRGGNTDYNSLDGGRTEVLFDEGQLPEPGSGTWVERWSTNPEQPHDNRDWELRVGNRR